MAPDVGREVLEIGVPIANPDPPADQIGSLILIYDWAGIQDLLSEIRVKLAILDKQVAALVVDGHGRVIGGVAFDGQSAQGSTLAAESWGALAPLGYGRRSLRVSNEAPTGVLVGAAAVAGPSEGWSIRPAGHDSYLDRR